MGETNRVRKAVRAMSDCLYQHTHVMHKLLKEIEHMTHMPNITVEQLQYGLAQVGYVFDLPDVERAVRFILPDCDVDQVPYHDFLKTMCITYQDLANIR